MTSLHRLSLNFNSLETEDELEPDRANPENNQSDIYAYLPPEYKNFISMVEEDLKNDKLVVRYRLQFIKLRHQDPSNGTFVLIDDLEKFQLLVTRTTIGIDINKKGKPVIMKNLNEVLCDKTIQQIQKALPWWKPKLAKNSNIRAKKISKHQESVTLSEQEDLIFPSESQEDVIIERDQEDYIITQEDSIFVRDQEDYIITQRDQEDSIFVKDQEEDSVVTQRDQKENSVIDLRDQEDFITTSRKRNTIAPIEQILIAPNDRITIQPVIPIKDYSKAKPVIEKFIQDYCIEEKDSQLRVDYAEMFFKDKGIPVSKFHLRKFLGKKYKKTRIYDKITKKKPTRPTTYHGLKLKKEELMKMKEKGLIVYF